MTNAESAAPTNQDVPFKDRFGPRFGEFLNDLPENWRTPVENLGRTVYRRAEDSRPLLGRLAHRASQATDQLGLEDATLAALEFAARAHPSTPTHWMRLARYHMDKDRPAEAAAAVEKALSIRPNYLPFFLSKIEIEDRFDPEQANLTLRRAVIACRTVPKRQRTLKLMDERGLEIPDTLRRFYLDRVNEIPDAARVTTAEITEAANLLAFSIVDSGATGPELQTVVDYLTKGTSAIALTSRLSSSQFQSLKYKTVRGLLEKIHADGHLAMALEYAEWAKSSVASSAWLDSFIARRRRDLKFLNDQQVPLPAQTVRRIEPAGTTTALYFLHNSLPEKSGGYATRTQGLLNGLKQTGHTVVGITRPGFPAVNGVFDQRAGIEETDVVHGITYHRLISSKQVMPRKDIGEFANHYADLAEKFVDEYRPSIIHAASNWWNGFGALASARRHDLPMVYEVRGLWELTKASRDAAWGESEAYRLDAVYEASVASQADHVITLSGALRNELVARGVDESKISIVPNAVDLTRFAPRPPEANLITKYKLAGKTVFGFAGTLTFYEGLDLLLEALAGLSPSQRDKVALLVVGDGPVASDLKALAKDLGISDLVHFVGRVPHLQVVNYLSVMDVTPFPRLPLPVCETVPPIKPLESMAMGRAVVVSSVHVLEEMIDDDETGLVFTAGDVDSLRAACAQLIESPELVTRLGENAREWAEQNRGWSAVSQTLAEVYEELR